jgi:hypothetical protein
MTVNGLLAITLFFPRLPFCMFGTYSLGGLAFSRLFAALLLLPLLSDFDDLEG